MNREDREHNAAADAAQALSDAAFGVAMDSDTRARLAMIENDEEYTDCPDILNDPIASSVCCGDETVDIDISICPECLEHCEVEYREGDKPQTRQEWGDRYS